MAVNSRRACALGSDRLERATEEMMRFRREIFDAMKAERERAGEPVRYTQGTANAVREAVTMVLMRLSAASLADAEKREALEARIAELEDHVTRP